MNETTETKLDEVLEIWKSKKDTGIMSEEQLNKFTDNLKTTVADPIAGLVEEIKAREEQNKLVTQANDIINNKNFYRIFLNDIQKSAPEEDQRRIGFNTLAKDMYNIFMKRASDESYNRLKQFETMQRNALQNEGTGSAGGLLVPTPTASLIMEDLRESGLFFSETNVIQLTGKDITIPTVVTHPTLSYVAEGAAKPVSNYVFGSASLTLKKYACLIPWTDELMEDAIVDIESLVRRFATDYFGILLDGILFDGDAQINGIADATTTFITLGAAGANNTVTIDNILQAIGAMKAGDLRDAKFYMSPSVWADLHTKKGTSNDHYLLTPDDIRTRTLFGFPVVLTDSLPASSGNFTASSEFIVFGNLKRVYVGVKNGMSIEMAVSNIASFLDGATQRSAFQDNLTVMRLEKRVAMAIPFPLGIVQIRTAAA